MVSNAGFVELPKFCDISSVHLKLEGLNIGGSIKIKTAVSLLDAAEAEGILNWGDSVIESSSGNLGIALSILCAQRGYRFTCVTDVNANRGSIDLMRAYGAEVIVCDKRDSKGGYLENRIGLIKSMLAENPKLYWTNQYANPANSSAHFRTTAPEVFAQYPNCKWLFVGAGTTGTLMGCIHYCLQSAIPVNVVAVDTVGSVTFQESGGKRLIPGIGTSRRPELVDLPLVSRVAFVDEATAVRTCWRVAADYGILVGGSTGSVLAAIKQLSPLFQSGDVVVAISPDLGDRYVDTVYNREWCKEKLGVCV